MIATFVRSTMRFSMLGVLLIFSNFALAQTTIMPLGDSITTGTTNFRFSETDYPLSADRLLENDIPPTLRSYREHLHDLLSSESCDASFEWVGTRLLEGRVPAVHEGVRGWTVDAFLNSGAWPDETGTYTGSNDFAGWVDEIQPEVVLIHLGSNDIGRGQTAVSTVTEMEELLDIIYAGNPATVVLMANLISINGWHGDHIFSAPQSAALIQEEAAAYTALVSDMVSLQPATWCRYNRLIGKFIWLM